MSAYELARSAGAPASTVYRLIDELTERDMLSRVDGNQVWLGPRLMRYGLTYRSNIDSFTEARREMKLLSSRTGETVQLCSRDDNMMVIIGMEVGSGDFRVTSDVGTRVPLNWTASGRLLVGHLPSEQRVESFRACKTVSETGVAETDPELLAKQSGEDFRNRIAVQIGAAEFAVACIAAPIRDNSNNCLMTMSIVLPEKLVQKRLSKLVTDVQEAALAVERALGRVSDDKTPDTDVASPVS